MRPAIRAGLGKRAALFGCAALLVLASAPAAVRARAGDPDPSFGSGGIVVDPALFPGGSDAIAAAALEPDGRVVVIGQRSGVVQVARFTAAGSPDPSFGTAGLISLPFASMTSTAVAVGAGGEIAVLGEDGDHSFGVALLEPDGAPDSSFGAGGEQTVSFPGTPVASAIAIAPGGRVIAAGYTDPTDTDDDFAVAVFRPSGGLDPSFAGDGTEITGLGGNDQATALVVLPDEGLLLGGLTGAGGGVQRNIGLVRYLPDGELDRGFGEIGSGGAAAVNIGESFPTGLALAPDGKILVTGSFLSGTTFPYDTQLFVARLAAQGSLDPAFGPGGLGHVSLAPESSGALVGVQPDGKILLAGEAGPAAAEDLLVSRLDQDGTNFDPSFGTLGRVTFDLHGVDRMRGLGILPDGRIVIAGSGEGGTVELVRLLGDPPDTALRGLRLNRHRRQATISFAGSGPAPTSFECELQRPPPGSSAKRRAGHRKPPPASFAACNSPLLLSGLRPGHYRLTVRAVSVNGTDATPPSYEFRTSRPRHRHRRKAHPRHRA